MTILTDDYAPKQITVTIFGERLNFPWPATGAESVEVYEIDGNNVRTYVSVNDYKVTFNGSKGFKFNVTGGQVFFSRPYKTTTVGVSIERNTLIDQTADFVMRGQFPPDIVEFVFDKATMILQEIAYRKCTDPEGTPVATAITQLITWYPYGPFTAQALNDALDKLTQIALEITGAKENCEDSPGDT